MNWVRIPDDMILRDGDLICCAEDKPDDVWLNHQDLVPHLGKPTRCNNPGWGNGRNTLNGLRLRRLCCAYRNVDEDTLWHDMNKIPTLVASGLSLAGDYTVTFTSSLAKQPKRSPAIKMNPIYSKPLNLP